LSQILIGTKLNKNCKEFVIMNQDEDPWVPIQHGKDLANYLHSELILLKGNDHFDKIDFDLLEKYILK
jgi:predicted alpha/beta hydrolase family esterase